MNLLRLHSKPGLLALSYAARSEGFRVQEIFLEQPCSWQNVDVILHKASEFYVEAMAQPVHSPDRQHFEAFYNYCMAAKPTVIVIDRIDCIVQLTSRLKIQALLTAIAAKLSLPNLEIPLTIVAGEAAVTQFPVVCKSIDACSHSMMVAFCEAQIDAQAFPLIQRYIPHSGRLFKIFVIGSKWFVVAKRSIPQFEHEAISSSCQQPYYFNTQMLDKQQLPYENQLDAGLLSAVAAAIKAETGLGLFGFDVLLEQQGRTHFIIDINYFPGFDGVPCFAQELLSYVRSNLAN